MMIEHTTYKFPFNNAAITIDVDWAPDLAIDFTAALLIKHHVKATWFITHQSPAIQRLHDNPNLFELGIHPNFLPGSTHGTSPEEILDHCMALVPDAISMRSHALVQSTPILDLVLSKNKIVCDASLFLPYCKVLEPVDYQWGAKRLLRLPYFWEDDVEMLRHRPTWDVMQLLETSPGLRILDFHPIHIFLNSCDMQPYTQLKGIVKSLNSATHEHIKPYINTGDGSGKVFIQTINYLSKNGGGSRLKDIYQEWYKNL